MIELNNISLKFGGSSVLEHFSLSVSQGEHIVLMGPSGSGKSTILRLIAGQLSPDSGDRKVTAKRISYMFQEPRLLPWLTAAENVNLVLGDKADTMPDAIQWLVRVGLQDAVHKLPSQLSGGMRQRVSLARALAFNGDLFLLDEPFSSLDEPQAETLMTLIEEHTQNKTVLLVTHNAQHAKRFADTIYLIKKQNA